VTARIMEERISAGENLREGLESGTPSRKKGIARLLEGKSGKSRERVELASLWKNSPPTSAARTPFLLSVDRRKGDRDSRDRDYSADKNGGGSKEKLSSVRSEK